jgi:fumarate reductase flavoprotein subunit
VDKGVSILRVCQQQLQPHLDSGRVSVRLDTEVTNLIQEADGRVTGVVARDQEGNRHEFMGRNIALTSGGYTSNSNFVWELEGVTDYAYNTYPFSKGAGISLGLQAGGYLRGGDKFLPLFASVLADDNYPSAIAGSLRHMPADRPLWEILVNVYGKRFVNEESDTFFAYEDALSKQPDMKCWAVFDEAILRETPPLLSGKLEWTTESIRKALHSKTPMFYMGQTVEELATNAGIGKEGLVETVENFNRGRKEGRDEFGRTKMPRAIAEPPFYAIRAHGTGLISFAGLAVDNNLRVVRKSGEPIEGLYAAGELLGAGQLMGRFYCGGMTVTPSLTFGRLLGQRFFKM